MSRTTLTTFTILTNLADGTKREVRAAYFQHEDRFTVFKGTDGEPVASFANDHLVGIERATS